MRYNKSMDYEDMIELHSNPVVREMKAMVDQFRELDFSHRAYG
ncbi:hypothetical protein [Effusibacillus consociatus]|uniref:Uncharacterized protein n=1 Tax=Effusibacillus consociatus TaxID=1117041 RepID=A0ABV9Q1Y0_9BACL